MTGQPGLIVWLALALFAVACLSSTGALAVPPAVTGEATAARMESTPNDQSAIPGTRVADEVDELPLVMGRPGSVAARLRLGAEPKEYLFQFPGVSEALKPWYDWKADLDKNHGFRFAISYTAYYQKANHVFGTEDDAAGFDLDISGTWTFLGRGTDSPTKLGLISSGATPWAPRCRHSDCSRNTELSTRMLRPTVRKIWLSANPSTYNQRLKPQIYADWRR